MKPYMKLYKLTDQNDQTHGGCQWGPGVTIETSGEGPLCGPGWTHWYTSPLLAVFLNPIHGNFNLNTAHLWEGWGEVGLQDHGLKVGCTRATTLKRVELPYVSITQRVAFGIYCALSVPQSPWFIRWANNWLSGLDRSYASATEAAAEAAREAARAAEAAAKAAEAAARAAREAARAAREAARAVARTAEGAAWVAAWAAEAVAKAVAWAVAWAAARASDNKELNLEEIAQKSLLVT